MIEERFFPTGVVGLGYVGLPLTIHLASHGMKVIGFDISSDVVSTLNLGRSHIRDIKDSQVVDLLSKNQIEFTIDISRIKECKVVIVCVPTPINESSEIDLSALTTVVASIKDHVTPGTLIVNESTSYPGTLREVFDDVLNQDKKRRSVFLATAPERVDPGSTFEFAKVHRVVGGIDPESTARAVDFYSNFFANVHKVTSSEVAELSKLLENTFRQVNISLVNEFNVLCRRVGIDTREVIEAAATKPYGFMKFIPSAGIGGHCIPVDPEYLQYFARRSGPPLRMISAASAVNHEMGENVVNSVEGHSIGRKLASALLLGVAYKPNIPDLRDTPAEAILRSLSSRGIKTDWHDPLVDTWHGQKGSNLNVGKWEVGIIVTAHDALDIEQVQGSCEMVFDCTGKYSNISSIVQI